jgi:hypothetical protein
LKHVGLTPRRQLQRIISTARDLFRKHGITGVDAIADACRAEAGHHHHIAGPYLLRYAQEASWREDHRRISNGEQTHDIAGLAMHKKTSPDFVGYWQRHCAAGSIE